MRAPSRFRSIGIVANPISGAGRSLDIARYFKDALTAAGYRVQLTESLPRYQDSGFEHFVSSIEVLVICGGDGTVGGLLELLAAFQVPIYVAPAGVESLFSTRFGMSAAPEDFLAVLESGTISEHRLVEVNGRAFFTVASVGLDSEIVCRISKVRQKAIGRTGYLLPALKAFCRHRTPRLTVKVDDELTVVARAGFFIAANSPCYAGNLNFVPEAVSSGETLFARFYPLVNKLWYFHWLYHYALRTPFSSAGSILMEGKTFEISAIDESSVPLQTDGDHCRLLPAIIRRSNKSIWVISRS